MTPLDFLWLPYVHNGTSTSQGERGGEEKGKGKGGRERLEPGRHTAAAESTALARHGRAWLKPQHSGSGSRGIRSLRPVWPRVTEQPEAQEDPWSWSPSPPAG